MEYEFSSKLNEYQIQAVLDDSSTCLVNAQVGSGKTTVLIEKIFYLHQVKKIPFEQMVVLTFTNKAANEIKERIMNIDTSIKEQSLLYFGTFHSVSLKLLKTVLPLDKINYDSNFTVIDPDEEVEIAMRLVRANKLQIKYATKLYKRLDLATQGKYLYSSMRTEDDIQHLIKLLQQEKSEQNKMAFSDLISYAILLLRSENFHPSWIIIDEFQDSDHSQIEFIKTLIGEQTQVFAVGDPNQVIYSWRGSNQQLFAQFKQQYNAKELSLPINYRSCGTILEVAKCFLHSSNDLSGLREQGNKIIIKNHYNPFNEAQYLCDQVKSIVTQGYQYKDIAIFYRLQRQSDTIESAFGKEMIPFEVSMRKTLKDLPVLAWLVKLFRGSVNPNDHDCLLYILTDKMYGEHLSSAKAKKILSGITPHTSALLNKSIAFSNWCATSTSILDAYEYFSIDNYINPTSSTFESDKGYILTLLHKIDDYITLKNLSILEGIKEFINSSTLYGIDILKDDIHIDNNTVKLMTLHASKGLEFKYVFIVGVNPGLLPLHTAFYSAQDEERRLFFVGITRAKDFLELSYYTSPDDARVMSGASDYLSIIPPHLVQQEQMAHKDIDLQSLRHEVSVSSETAFPASEERNVSDNIALRKVRHLKYGIGTVLSETEDTLTVTFDGYGEKEFFKAFSELENY